MTDTTTQSSSSSTADDPITLLRQLTGSNYHRAATEPPEVAHGYQAIADVLATVDPATWTPHTHELPAAEVADQIAASLFIRLRTVPADTAVYRELDGIRQHFHHLRHTAIHAATSITPGQVSP